MNPHVNAIANRLSLRRPQRDALEILDRVCEVVKPDKDTDAAQALQVICSEFPTVTEFERDFPSLCFALATGVAKTRLMGAFIAYLYRVESIRHFFVMAPNLTIYNKLLADFTPNTPKYVFQGIAEFATSPPEIITGDNYENGRGVRGEVVAQQQRMFGGEAVAFQYRMLFDTSPIHINIFNISKINSEVRGDRAPRIKRLSEYIGESYFEYLSRLDDLVLLMDESHRYRASAGVRAINELKPILGLELTATPQVERGGRAEPFKNVIYSYPLSQALKDGYVKEPAVATRENFVAANYKNNAEGLERLKLEDGIHVHEETKVQLDIFARENGRKRVKPFMMVVAQDTEHANALVRAMEDESFFGGAYKGKVITVHSNLRGEEKDETVQQLLTVEDPDNPTEVVVHVNMLKEGWDVTNLYTIVPLRAANSKTLVEQSIGRGLRLPYGKRVGGAPGASSIGPGIRVGDDKPSVSPVDRLVIVSHDKFQEIIDEANRTDSIIRTGIVIGKDIPLKKSEVVEVKSKLEERIAGTSGGDTGAATPPPQALFDKPEERQAARTTLDIIKQYERLRRSSDLKAPEIQKEIAEKVKEALKPSQGVLTGIAEEVDVEKVVRETTEAFVELSIDIPRIIVVPTGESASGFTDFDLDVRTIRYQPDSQNILIHHLHDHSQHRLRSGGNVAVEAKLENYLVGGLIDFNDICYDNDAQLLYKLASQCVAQLRSYLKDEDDVLNVLLGHREDLVRLIHAQMQDHFEEDPAE